jgi:phosphatidylserine decarboxylase
MQSIKEFLSLPETVKIKNSSMGDQMSELFFRDPPRTVIYNPEMFYAPADGVVLYAKKFKADEFLEIKGKDFPLSDLLVDEDYKEESLVVGIFMTAYSVHINRVPNSAYYIGNRETSFIYTHNISMLMMENDLLQDFRLDKKNMGYLTSNEKKVSIFHCPAIKGRFYVVQVGDKDIDVVLNYGKGKHLLQGDRFGQIKWGSQTDIIVPLKPNMDYEFLVKPLDYVEAGKDPVIKIVLKEDDMPYSMKKTKSGKYSVSSPNMVHSKGTTKEKAKSQMRLLNAVEHNPNWKPSGRKGFGVGVKKG